ncbi:MAG: N-6 DNA methylase [Synergistaceae bacterium]|nr:N-6 DNA methylase [Synergistaceae bacterium]
MYELKKLFKDSAYNSAVFSYEIIRAVEDLIYVKNIKGVEVPYIKCQIRDKEIKLTPEEAVRQLYIYKLIHEYGYDKSCIELERAIHFGREVKRADIVILDREHKTEYIIVELKKPKLSDGKEQLKSYCNATGAIIGVWTNGQSISHYHRRDPNYFIDIPDIPKANQDLFVILNKQWYIQDLIDNDKLIKERKSLKSLILEMEDEVLAGAGVDVFEEVFKLIYTKLYDEMQSGRDKTRALEFRNYSDEKDNEESDLKLKNNLQNLFDKAKKTWPGVFDDKAAINLTPSHLAVCVSSLQNVKLFNSNLDVIDDAFEYLMSKSQKGEKGQYFTPRYVIDMCVKMLNPKADEKMIDTAAGSCGFPVHTIFHVWQKILEDNGIKQSHLFTAEKKPAECEDYVNNNVFAIDFDEKAVRVARTLNLIAGDGRTNVLHLNTLDYERWRGIVKNDEKWQDIYNEGWIKFRKMRVNAGDDSAFNFDIVMANPPFAGDIKESKIIAKYELGKNAKGKYQSKVGRDILFIERNLNFLKPGGRMAIILPQGRFNNSSDKYIREFIAERCRILAVVGLHGNVFKPHTGTKTSVLFVQKWDEELCPRKDNYPIFLATMQKPSKDNSGDKIFVRGEDGEFKLDKHGHLIVDHDLFNHENLTQDGIAEAFIEFAKRENLSFFNLSPSFNAERYAALMDGLECSEVLLSEIDLGDRIDAEYFTKEYLNIQHNLSLVKTLKIGELASTVASAFYPAATQLYAAGDTPFIRCVDCINYPIISNEQDTSFEKIPRSFARDNHGVSMLEKNEIVITKVGTPCYTSIVDDYNEVALSRTVLGLRNIQNISPHYLMTFLRSKYGFTQLYRQRELTIQYQLTLPRVKAVEIFIPSKNFQSAIEGIIKQYRLSLKNSRSLYSQAQAALTKTLNFKPVKNTSNIEIKDFSQSFALTGRLDAEYYMPKYDEYLKMLNSSGNEVSYIKNEFELVKTKCDRKNQSYRYIEIGDIDISSGSADFNIINADDLPDNAKIMTRKGDILVSTVRPNRGAVAILEEDGFLVSGAFTVLHEKGNINKEVLHVILRSEIYRDWLLRYNVGTSYPVIKDEDVLNMYVPVLPQAAQREIAEQVQNSFKLKSKAEDLINKAIKAVELAIEQDEDTAINYINA